MKWLHENAKVLSALMSLALSPAIWAAESSERAYEALQHSIVYISTHNQAHQLTSGTGFLVDRRHKRVVTCYHVVNQGQPIQPNTDNVFVTFPEYQHGQVLADKAHYQRYDRPIRAIVVAMDATRDLAVLELELVTPEATALSLAEKSMHAGERVYLAGNPGRSKKLWEENAGVVRSLGQKQMRYVRGQVVDTAMADVKTEVPVLPGYSGGPVVDADGKLLGVVSAANFKEQTMLAVDVKGVQALLELLRRHPGDETLRDPRSTADYCKRGWYYCEQGHYAEAIADFHEALRLDPKNPSAYQGLAWLWSTCPQAELRHPKQAIALARRACDLSDWKRASMLDTLAAAYAAGNQFDEAVRLENEALHLTDSRGAEMLRQRLALYQAGKPYIIHRE